MKKYVGRSPRAAVVTTIALIVSSASVVTVSAAVPSSGDGRIHGCYRTSASLTDAKGALRTIDSDAGQSCASGEAALNWSPQGKTGGTIRKDLAGKYVYDVTFRNQDLKGVSLAGATVADVIIGNIDGDNVNAAGVTMNHLTMTETSFKGANFSGATLYDINVPEIPVPDDETTNIRQNIDFRNANFSNAHIGKIYASFYYFEIDFRGANVNNLTFTDSMGGVNFSGTDFRSAHFVPTDPYGIIFPESNFSNTNFSGMTLDNIGFNDIPSSISHADFSNTTITRMNVHMLRPMNGGASYANFTNANIDNSIFTITYLANANFKDTVIRNTDFGSSTFTDADFTGADIKDASFYGAKLDTVNFTNARLENVNFMYASLDQANLMGTTLTNVTCSDGVNSDANGGSCAGHLVRPN